MTSADEGQVRTGIDLAREFHVPVFDELARAAGRESKFAGLRPAAIDACMTCDRQRAIELVAAVLASPTEPMRLRQHCATALARTNNDQSRAELIAQLQTAPERLAVAIANGLADGPAGAEALLDSVWRGKAFAATLQETSVLTRLRARKLDQLDERLATLTAGLPAEDQRIQTQRYVAMALLCPLLRSVTCCSRQPL